MILTNAAAKRDFYLIRHFGVKMSPALSHTQRQVGRIKLSYFKLRLSPK